MIDKARSAAANLMFDFGCCTPLKVCVLSLALGSISRVNSVCLLFTLDIPNYAT